jgi:hypothetical protein
VENAFLALVEKNRGAPNWVGYFLIKIFIEAGPWDPFPAQVFGNATERQVPQPWLRGGYFYAIQIFRSGSTPFMPEISGLKWCRKQDSNPSLRMPCLTM